MAALEKNGVPASRLKVTLEEFQINVAPPVAKAGSVQIAATNVGTLTHEMVMVRPPLLSSRSPG